MKSLSQRTENADDIVLAFTDRWRVDRIAEVMTTLDLRLARLHTCRIVEASTGTALPGMIVERTVVPKRPDESRMSKQ